MGFGVKPCALGFLKTPLRRIIFSITIEGSVLRKIRSVADYYYYSCVSFLVCTRLLWLLSYFPSHHKRLVLHNSKIWAQCCPWRLSMVYIYYLTERARSAIARAHVQMLILYHKPQYDVSCPKDGHPGVRGQIWLLSFWENLCGSKTTS